jgi:hypothetical protein
VNPSFIAACRYPGKSDFTKVNEFLAIGRLYVWGMSIQSAISFLCPALTKCVKLVTIIVPYFK